MALILSKKHIESVLTMKESIATVEEAFRELALKTAQMPTRASLSILDKEGWMGAMPAYLSKAGALTTKIVTSYENNPARHKLPTIMAVIVLNDPETGRTEAVLEGSYITAVRTGAVSGVATEYLAKTDATTVGIFGAGTQAQTQLEAVMVVRNVESVLVHDIVPEKAARFSEQMSQRLRTEVRAEDDRERVAAESEIIITASTSKVPVFKGASLSEGTHINAIGSFTPDARELDDSTILRAKIVVDSLDAALAEAGDLLIPMKAGIFQRDQIYAELGEIIVGRRKARESDLEITVFKSVGLGIQDAAVARLAYVKATRMGIGDKIELS